MNQTVRKPLNGTLATEDDGPLAIREAAGLSQEEMAELLGMGDYGYSAWERGARQPGGPARKLLALIASDPEAIIALFESANESRLIFRAFERICPLSLLACLDKRVSGDVAEWSKALPC